MITMPTFPDVVAMTGATSIWLCAGIPWDNTYKHVRLFASKDAAVTYIKSKAVHTMTAAVPIRNMTIRLNVPEDMINRQPNYILYQNANFTNEYFMGFITDTKWLSVNSCEITFEFDIFQTFWYSASLSNMYVIREHVSNDAIGANILDEGIPYGDLVYTSAGNPAFGVVPWVAIYVSETKDAYGEWGPVGGSVIGGVYSALYPLLMKCETDEDKDAIYLKLKEYIEDGKTDAIAFITMLVSGCVNEQTLAYNLTRPVTIDGYTPRNNKLFTYPYLRVVVHNNLGQTQEFKYELSNDGALHFSID